MCLWCGMDSWALWPFFFFLAQGLLVPVPVPAPCPRAAPCCSTPTLPEGYLLLALPDQLSCVLHERILLPLYLSVLSLPRGRAPSGTAAPPSLALSPKRASYQSSAKCQPWCTRTGHTSASTTIRPPIRPSPPWSKSTTNNPIPACQLATELGHLSTHCPAIAICHRHHSCFLLTPWLIPLPFIVGSLPASLPRSPLSLWLCLLET